MEVSNGLIPAIFFRPAFSYVLKLREDNIFWLSPQLLQVSPLIILLVQMREKTTKWFHRIQN